MSIQIIQASPNASTKPKIKGLKKLSISEFFYNTIQGEGVSAGVPAAFLRLQHCTLNCNWCDTTEVWRSGSDYEFDELFFLMEGEFIDRLNLGERLILTGGSPLRQAESLYLFINEFEKRYRFLPYTEIENECVLDHTPLTPYVNQWNNSPKLSNSGMRREVRYKPELIQKLSTMPNSWFKFVVDTMGDWDEIVKDFLPIIDREQIILMPQGATQKELNQKRGWVADLAAHKGVRFSDRLHVTVWDKRTGV